MDKTTERIKADALKAIKVKDWGESLQIESYIAGATAENERNESIRLQLEAQNANVEILLAQKNDLMERAQKMANVLDNIGNGPFPITQKELEEWLLKTKAMAREALEQWRGTEVEQETTTHKLSTDEKKKILANKIEARMKEAGLQRQEFADLMGTQPSTITRWLSGEHNFQIDTLFEIEKQLNISLFNL